LFRNFCFHIVAFGLFPIFQGLVQSTGALTGVRVDFWSATNVALRLELALELRRKTGLLLVLFRFLDFGLSNFWWNDDKELRALSHGADKLIFKLEALHLGGPSHP